MATHFRTRQFGFSVLAVLLAFSSLLLITSLTFAKPTGTIVVNPGDSIQAAIDAANPGDTILINAGTYTESLTLNKAVSLTGVSRATVIIRSPSGGHVIAVTGGNVNQTVVISGLMVTGGSSYYGGGMYVTDNAQPLIQNVTFIGNSASFEGMGGGGGLYSGSSLTLTSVDFVDNTADNGGGMYLGGDVIIILTDCRFINNFGGGIASEVDVIPAAANRVFVLNTDFLSNTTYTGYDVAGLRISGEAFVTGGRFENNVGGGLRAEHMVVSGTRFISNSARLGGAILGGDVLVANSYFERNTANSEGGAIRAYRSLHLTDTTFINNTGIDYGGAVSVEQIEGVASVVGGQFVNNRVSSGDLYGLGGGIYSFYDVSVTTTNFISNSALRGGGLYARMAATIENSRFERNTSTGTRFSGGGGMVAVGPLNVTNTQFVNNSAIFDGGGLYFSGGGGARIVNSLFAHNTTNSDGAALFFYSTGGHVDLLHTTIADHTLNPRQAIFAQNGSIGITNTIIANYAIGIERWSGATVSEDYNLYFNNSVDFSGTVITGTHDVFGDPNFVDPDNGDYHIVPPSAAINAGVDAGVYTDLDGNVRPVGGGFDIGAYEATSTTTPITGLVTMNDSPTRLGDETILVAFVQAGDEVGYLWDFGDGSTLGNHQSVTHTYPAAGIYTAVVTASNSVSVVTATTHVTVDVPLSGLTAENNSPTLFGNVTILTATISAGSNVTYTWNYGDGSPTASGITATHAYPAVGIYTASVTAQNSVSVLTATTRITITDVPVSGLTAVNSSPTAIGSVTTLTATVNAGSNVTYTWNFGDGSSLALGQVVTHTYLFSVTSHFTATVTAVNSVGAQFATTAVILLPQRVYLPVLIR